MPVTGNLTHQISPARLAALEVLEAVAAGGYASDELRERTRDLSSRNAGLATQIVFGCLRYQSQLDFLIFHYSGRKALEFDLDVLLALRIALLQLRYLERVPAHAAVHESVEFVKSRKRAAANLTNAVLRKVNREAIAWPDLTTELSCPEWLVNRWSAHFGPETARRIAITALNEPEAYVRIPPGSALPTDLQIEPTAIPGAYRLPSAAPSGIRFHDIGSQAIVPLLELRPGDTYLDVCAAPGNKTLQALETPLALAVACDVSSARIREIPNIIPRVQLDATQPFPFGQEFSRVFVDAPCSGTGTLGRNPEIKWRVSAREINRLGERQLLILSRASETLLPGGRLVYATCSLEEEENERVVERALAANPALRCLRTVWRIPSIDEGDGFFAAVLEFRRTEP